MVHLSDPDQLAGDQVAEAIGRLGDASAVPLLLAALSDTDETLRARAATALGLLRAEEAIPQLSTMRRLDGPLARRSAAEALAAIGTPAATVALNALNPQPILAPIAALPAAPAPSAALPGTLADIPADYWTRAAMVALLALMLLAVALIGKGPRRPKTHFGPA
jgi:HEAT repeat protein